MTRRHARGTTWFVIAIGGLGLIAAPAPAPWAVLPGLLLALVPTLHAWKDAEGTALRASVVWAGIALGFGIATECAALLEPISTGRPSAGHLAYLCCLATLAGLISVLNARTPGGGAWAILMALLVVVFLIPWLEGSGLGRGANSLARLRLDNPWTIFFALLVFAGVTNYLPTRFGPAAAALAVGFLLEYLALTRIVASRVGLATVWTAFPWTLAVAGALVGDGAEKARIPARGLDTLWFWFRDRWGVVWGLRVMERFNRSAASLDWPVRLGWHGTEDATGKVIPGDSPASAEASAVLSSLLRRFATAERRARASGTAEFPPLPRS